MKENNQYLLGFFVLAFGGLFVAFFSFFDILLARIVFISSLLITLIVISPLLGENIGEIRRHQP